MTGQDPVKRAIEACRAAGLPVVESDECTCNLPGRLVVLAHAHGLQVVWPYDRRCPIHGVPEHERIAATVRSSRGRSRSHAAPETMPTRLRGRARPLGRWLVGAPGPSGARLQGRGAAWALAVRVSGARPVMIVTMRGDEELGFRAADLAGRLPEALAPLARIAYNYRWRWYPGGKEVFRWIDPDRCGVRCAPVAADLFGRARRPGR
jgi:hypothetical protein